MTSTLKPPYDEVQNPMIKKLLVQLETMPEFLANRRIRIHEKREFHRKVWQGALLKAGLITEDQCK